MLEGSEKEMGVCRAVGKRGEFKWGKRGRKSGAGLWIWACGVGQQRRAEKPTTGERGSCSVGGSSEVGGNGVSMVGRESTTAGECVKGVSL